MKRQIISCVLVASILFSIGCYSTGMVTKDEFKAKAEKDDITVLTKESLEYKFSKGNYRVQGDTLSGSGVRVSANRSARDSVVTSIAFADITLLKTEEFDLTNTILFCVGVGMGGVCLFYLSASIFVERD